MDSSSPEPNFIASTKLDERSIASETEQAFVSILYNRPSGEKIVCGKEEYLSALRDDLWKSVSDPPHLEADALVEEEDDTDGVPCAFDANCRRNIMSGLVNRLVMFRCFL